MEAPHNIQNYRREQCERCPKPCDRQKDEGFRKEGSNVCPINRWMAYELHQRWRGAGDLVASVAQPIAGAIDKVLKTNVKGCSACQKRKEMLNQYLPFNFNP